MLVNGILKYISSGKNVVIGVNAAGHVFQRQGVSAASPAGTSWRQLDGALGMVDALIIWRNWGISPSAQVLRT